MIKSLRKFNFLIIVLKSLKNSRDNLEWMSEYRISSPFLLKSNANVC